jgi:lysophospholipase L1-like esterase
MQFDEKSTRLIPLWEGNTVYRETVMFVGANDRAPLLFAPQEILCVTDYGGEIIYVQGEDFVLNEDGTLSLTEATRIPFLTEQEFYHDNPSSIISVPHNGKDTFIYWGEGTSMTRWQLAVTYTHKAAETLPIPTDFSYRYAPFFKKLKEGKNATVYFFGDSITAGANASYTCQTAPHMLPWTSLFAEQIAKKFSYTLHYQKLDIPRMPSYPPETDYPFGDRGKLTFINTAVGGWRTKHGIEHLEERVLKPIAAYGCDLFVFGFGMNDGRLTSEEYIANTRLIIDRILEVCPDAAILLIATMFPNPDAPRWHINQTSFEGPLLALAEEYAARGVPCAVAPMTSMSKAVLTRKRFHDYSANNVNHPNDFMIRLYAQTLLRTVLGDEVL